MFKKTITYTDYDGNQRTEDFLFNLTKAEIAEMELSTQGGLTKKLERIANEQDGAEITKILKSIILDSYGKKSDDGRRFIKTEQLKEEFAQTEAYSELFIELATNSDAAAEFINQVVPNAPENNRQNVIPISK